LFLKGLKPEVTKEELVEQFKKYGEIVSCAVKDFTYQSKPSKFGFVAFKSIGEAEEAKSKAVDVEEIKKFFQDKPFINVFQSKEQRTKFLTMQWRSKSMQPFMGAPFPGPMGPMGPIPFGN
jgi:RNA recognition motif-containing protein